MLDTHPPSESCLRIFSYQNVKYGNSSCSPRSSCNGDEKRRLEQAEFAITPVRREYKLLFGVYLVIDSSTRVGQ